MVVAVVAGLVGLGLVLVLLYAERSDVQPAATGAPDWDPLPLPADITRASFPRAFPGYDAAAVDAALERLTAAYGALLAVVTPEQRARARRALAHGRQGRTDLGEPDHQAPPPVSSLAADEPPDTREALHLEAALAAIPADPAEPPYPARNDA